MDRAEREEREGRNKYSLSTARKSETPKIRVFGFEWRGDDAPP